MKRKSTQSGRSRKAVKSKPTKPPKPFDDFPLFAHRNGQWAKKIRGRLHYFGCWDSPDAALELYQSQREDLYAGRKPRGKSGGLTVHELCNAFIADREQRLNAGEITNRSFGDYVRTCEAVIRVFGKTRLVDDLRADDFNELRAKLGKRKTGKRRVSPATLGNEVQRVRVLFKYGFDAGLIDQPVRFGPSFKRPPKRILRAARHEAGPRMLEARHIRMLLKVAPAQIRAMILLGINCGFGNADCGRLPLKALDLKHGWINYPRPKTAIPRRCPLWPETVAAIKQWLTERPEPKDDADAELVFLTKYRTCWHKDRETPASPLSAEFRKLLNTLGLHRKGLGFYALRHGFETIGGDSRDQVATDFIMGHSDQSMAATYRERIDDDRLRDVADHVRRWLFRGVPEYRYGKPRDIIRPRKPTAPAPTARRTADDGPRLRVIG